MTLDRFTGTKRTKKKKTSKPKKEKVETIEKKKIEKEKEKEKTAIPTTRKKFFLKCTAKCGYQRKLNKRQLNEDDYFCRKCGKKMKLVKS